ncbi:MAG: hypothetical protein JHD33_05915, partial [Chthoniobacterales bacterium]|nr:hypothetical protein [Chthoniobacterales bacterium]
TPSVSNNTYMFKGRAGAAFTNGLTWTNPAAGTSGAISFPGGNAANGWAWSVQIPLAAGSNHVRFEGVYPSNGTTIYSDSAASYGSWTQGAGAGAELAGVMTMIA